MLRINITVMKTFRSHPTEANNCLQIQAIGMFLPLPNRFLLILNRTGRRSLMHTSLLVFYLLTSFPTGRHVQNFKVLAQYQNHIYLINVHLFSHYIHFKVAMFLLRGQRGCWLAIAANLFFPETFSRFALFQNIYDDYFILRIWYI